MVKILLFLFLAAPSFAQKLGALSADYSFQDRPEYQAILLQLKAFGEFSPKTQPPTVTTEKKMTRGEQAVAEAKARNRAIIKESNDKEKAASEENKDLTELEKMKLEVQKTQQGWKDEVREQLKTWQKEQKIFLGKLKVYKANTFEIPAAKEVIVEKQVIENLPEVHIVNEAFSAPIRDQSARATCSAFAGIRAIEILLAQNKINKDLSEQYFYWASKPNCQTSPCQQKGSWVRSAFDLSKQRPGLDIPSEENCAYQQSTNEKNETQIPLQPKCLEGSAKVVNFTEARTLSDVVDGLKLNRPVIMAAKLSENFYKNQGLVTLKDSSKPSGSSMDRHSLGHAFLAVGLLELPEKLKADEGNFCIIVANSWGKGWGAGGYSCLTEKWLTKFRQPSPFIAVTEVSAK